jgi:hypothetical protein
MDLALQASCSRRSEKAAYRRLTARRQRPPGRATHRNLAELARQQRFRVILLPHQHDAPGNSRCASDAKHPLLARILVRDLAAEICRHEPDLDRELSKPCSATWPGSVPSCATLGEPCFRGLEVIGTRSALRLSAASPTHSKTPSACTCNPVLTFKRYGPDRASPVLRHAV